MADKYIRSNYILKTEKSTEIDLNILATTEKTKTSLTENVLENVENVLFNVTNLTEESQYNDSSLNGT